ncbi:MAG: tRNA 2-thiouridine(34) synthase MnmA [Spirochaetales bacterium]|nr:tRNA 2-thiouridine(34) synthase MnmA [Spirochaetales bacterium]
MVLAVGMSGGVDSSVAALLLKERFPRLVGVTHLIWPGSRCCSGEALSRAAAVCRRLGIAHVQVDLFERFREAVVEEFVNDYLEGRTPNPCVLCNGLVRFDAFHSRLVERLGREGLLEKGEELCMATGHYARITRSGEETRLEKGRDPLKDQSYMLYRVRREMLSRLVLPLGEYHKARVLELAESAGLEYRTVRESQDACFVEGSYVEFIRRYTGRDDLLRPGEIRDQEGRLLGRHRGTVHYTVGQRRGLGLGSGPWYVARLDPGANRVVVARRQEAESRSFRIGRANWLVEIPGGPLRCGVKVRYQSEEVRCRVEPEAEGRAGDWRVTLERPEILTPGQSAVFYDGTRVLGGGIIQPR